MVTRSGQVTIAGAGPGDADLISVKALKAIASADVLLYDALVNRELLSHAKPGCQLVNVGKRKGMKEFSQEEINELLVYYARQGGYVVRLKGGDPFVFGRGYEEQMFLIRHGIGVDLIPGISSAVAAPSAAGIPLTLRGVNESFWVITGTVSSGAFSKDIVLAAQSSATVVILMGMTHLDSIMKIVQAHRGGYEPVAVIENATLPHQRIARGDAATIASIVSQKGVGAPAVIVIGQVAHESLCEILSHEAVKTKVAA